jgi:argininosuccinate lyase
MDAVSDRDFLIDFLSSSSILMMHLSRFSEEIIIWSSTDFGFVELSEDFSTGSSIMPQKRNPDFAELARGKTGRVFGSLFGLLTVLKGLPLTYNRDLQEDKEGFFDTLDTINATLEIFIGMIGSIKVKPNQMRNTALKGQLLATDYADYLVGKGLPFREAYGIINKLSSYAIKNEKDFSEISLKELKKFSTKFDQDINEISLESSVENRNVFGGTSQEQVKKALATAKAQLKENK